jgi:hypothetical protein
MIQKAAEKSILSVPEIMNIIGIDRCNFREGKKSS